MAETGIGRGAKCWQACGGGILTTGSTRSDAVTQKSPRPLPPRNGAGSQKEARRQGGCPRLPRHPREPDLSVLASAWHTDADLGRPVEVIADMTKSRKLGFLDYQATDESFISLFDELQNKRVIPPRF